MKRGTIDRDDSIELQDRARLVATDLIADGLSKEQRMSVLMIAMAMTTLPENLPAGMKVEISASA